jgi:hypothetical protein
MSEIRAARWGVLLLLAAVADGLAADPVYYVFQMDGKPIGYAEITADELTLDGQSLQRLRSTTTLKFALGSATHTVIRRATTLVQPDTGAPTYYELTQDANGNVNHIECKFEGQQVRTWQWKEGAPKGDPQDTPVTPLVRILGSNDFTHWGLLLKAAGTQPAAGTADLTVFLPDMAKTQSIRLKRGEPQNLDVAGTSRACQAWLLEGAGIDMLVDAQSGQFLRMNIPAQKTTVMLSDASVAQNAQQAPLTDILARHFAQSNVVFDDFLKVSSLKAKIDVSMIGEGVGQDASVLRTAMQEFEGDMKDSSITGTITVRSSKYAGSEKIPFPSTDPADAGMAPWLQPATMIESDDAGIVARARELTKGVANRWQAVSSIAQWVHKEIRYTIADTPSARLALEKLQGDCGPHATLTVAMLRALGIPAKLVGGLVYAPTLGGSFGQHAWVEVHMGDDGWVAFDPTTGEFESMSATHIKLFEGMGGVIPAKVEVVAYEPPNREIAAAAMGAAKPLNWKFDTDYTYTYLQNGQKLGTEVFRWKKTQVDGKDGLELNSTMDITAAGKKVHSATRLLTQPDVIPLLFHRDYDVNGAKSARHCEFTRAAVKVKVTGPSEASRDIAIKEGTYCFDNNLLPSFAMICSQLDLKENQKTEIRTFHPTSMTVIPLSFQIKGVKQTSVAGQNVECFECFVEPIKNTFWITPDGRLVKVEAPGLVVEVSP